MFLNDKKVASPFRLIRLLNRVEVDIATGKLDAVDDARIRAAPEVAAGAAE